MFSECERPAIPTAPHGKAVTTTRGGFAQERLGPAGEKFLQITYPDGRQERWLRWDPDPPKMELTASGVRAVADKTEPPQQVEEVLPGGPDEPGAE